MTLTRTELIHELRGHTTKRELDKLVKLPTAEIRAALAYALSSEKEKHDRVLQNIRERERFVFGIDFGFADDCTVIMRLP